MTPSFSLPRRFSGRSGLLFAAGAVVAVAVAGLGAQRLIAQIEGDRGIAPIVSTGNIEISGVEVDVTGKNAADARNQGWREAERLAWAKSGGPQLDDGTIDGLVAAVTVEQEEVGPHRYHARLTVSFDRDRAGEYVAGANGAVISRSAPLLVIPVLYSGGVSQVYEVRGPWQKAWAEFHTGASAIDYVRPSGAGGDSLLLTAGQAGRRSRLWWRGILQQYGASDVLMPEARLERQWPGGPVQGSFAARYGPDSTWLGGFTLSAPDEGGVPAMLAEAIRRIDSLYADALARGLLRPDASLRSDGSGMDPGLAGLVALGQRAQAEQEAAAQAALSAAPSPSPEAKPSAVAASGFTVQFASPDAHAVDAALASVRSTAGVQAASTTSIAIGGTSVMRVNFGGGAAELAAALRARGWQVAASGSTLRIRR